VPRDRSVHGEQLEGERGRLRRLVAAALRNAAERRLQRRDPAAGGGPAQRSRAVVAHAQRRHAGCHGGGVATAGTPRRVPGRPRIAGGAAQRAGGVPAHPELRHVRPPHRDRSGGPKLPDVRRVPVGDRVSQRRDAVRRRRPGHVDVLLDRHRHTAQRRRQPIPPQRRVGLPRCPQRVGGQHHGDRVQRGVDLPDPVQVRLDHLAGRHLPHPHQPRQLASALRPQFRHQILPAQIPRAAHGKSRAGKPKETVLSSEPHSAAHGAAATETG
jgi:hypothetical protein